MLNQEQQIFEQIKKAKDILITFSKDWNGDAVASSLALFLFLKKLDKNVELIAAEPNIKNESEQKLIKLFSFLPAISEIKNKLETLKKFIISLDITNTKVKQVKYHKEDNALNFIISPEKGFFTASDISSRAGEFKYDLIITVGTPDLESLGKIYDDNTEFFYQVPIINIDHQSNNEEFGQINYVELKAVATSEILFSLFENYSRELIDEDVATCLLAGIIYQTKSFKTTNITPQTLLITSQLISMGGRREEIVNKFYRSRNLNVLKLWGRVLARLSSSSDNQLIWSTLSSVDFIKTEAKEEDLSDVIDELIINIPQAKIVLIIYEKKKKPEEEAISATEPQTKISIYSVKNINLLDLAKEYNPVGTKKLISLTFKKGLVETEKEIINFIKDKLSKLDL